MTAQLSFVFKRATSSLFNVTAFLLAFIGAIRLDASLLVAFPSAIFSALLVKKLMSSDERHIRGKRMLSIHEARKETQRICARLKDTGFDGFGSITLPKSAKYTNFLFQGEIGTGKTILSYPLMYEAAKDPNARLLLHDFKMVFPSFLSHIGIPKERIKILNPFDKRSLGWDIQADCPNDAAANEIAESLSAKDTSKDKGDKGDFFDTSAKILLSSVIKYFVYESRKHTDYRWNLRDVIEAVSNKEDMQAMFEQYSDKLKGGLTFLKDPNADVDRTIETVTHNLKPLAALWQGKETYSFRKWKNTNDILVLGYESAYSYVSGVVNGLFLRLAMKSVQAQMRVSDLNDSWFFLEEFPTIQFVPGFDDFISTAREKKTCVVLIFQSISQVRDRYREKQAAITQACANKVFLNSTEEGAKWASERTGGEEIEEESTGDQINFKSGAGASTNRAPKVKPVLMPEQFEQLPTLEIDGKIHAIFVTRYLGYNPFYYSFTKHDLAHIWKDGGYPADYDRIDEDEDVTATELDAWTDVDRRRVGIIREVQPREKKTIYQPTFGLDEVIDPDVEQGLTFAFAKYEGALKKL